MKSITKDRIRDKMQGVRSLWAKYRPIFRGDRKSLLSQDRTEVLILRGRRAVRKVDADSRKAVILQYRLLTELIKENQNTEYGKKYGFSGIRTVQDFRKKVPLSEYDD